MLKEKDTLPTVSLLYCTVLNFEKTHLKQVNRELRMFIQVHL